MRLRLRIERSGFTLMEVVLASFIAVGFMIGLFLTMNTYLQQMQAGREVVEQSSLSRALFARISNDLSSSLAPTQPTPSTTSAASGTGATSSTTSSMAGQIVFQIGVKGDQDRVAIYLTRLTRSVVTPPDDGSGNQNPYAADIRRICYFATANGLARQEILMVTSDQVDDLPTDVDEFTKVLAGEVKSFEVRYFNGSSWQDSWDGSTPGPDGKTPQGPPRAIEVTLGIALPGSDDVKTFKHAIAFPAAPGAASTDSSSSTTTP
jgi:hypothetical protein